MSARVTAFAAGDRKPTVTLEVADHDVAVQQGAALAADYFYVAVSVPALLGRRVTATWQNGRDMSGYRHAGQ